MTRKRLRDLSKRIAVLLIFSLCINSYSAIVSDNDGSAFVTKAEFESLKVNFANQITNYNDSIDSKIDGAIASYLAGVQLAHTTILDNKYSQINPTWVKDKRFNQSHKGTKYTEYISFIEGTFNYPWIAYIFEGTSIGWYNVKERIENESDQEFLYRISKKTIGPFEKQWSLQDLIKVDYSITIGGGAAGGRGGSYYAENRLLFPTATTFKKITSDGNEQKLFGTWYDTLPIEVWNVNPTSKTKVSYIDNIGGSGGGGETCAITAIAKDVIEDNTNCFYLAGGSLTNETMYCLNTASVSELGDMFATAETNRGGTRHIKGVDIGTTGAYQSQYLSWTTGEGAGTTDYGLGIKAEVYRHVLNEVNSTDLLHEGITQLTNQKAYYYSGCPMFTTLTNGKVTFKIKFDNTDGAKTKWALKDKSFTNTANPGNADGLDECSETTFNADDDETREVSFQAKKDTTYWIKAEPASGRSTIEFIGDIVIVEE